MSNQERGPVAEPITLEKLHPGDLIQLSFVGGGTFQHSLVVTKLGSPINLEQVYITTHTSNRLNEKLTAAYTWKEIRFIHILGSRF